MNFLAHAVLSFGDNEILTGNMISDFVKGKKKYDYPEEIRYGIELHRMIDTFTDNHPKTKEAKSFFTKDYRLYSGPIIDIVFDHFLANDPKEFKNILSLEEFSKDTYAALEMNQKYWPAVFSTLFPYMKSEDWLAGYRMVTGIQKSLNGLSRRALYMNSSDRAYEIFLGNYTQLQYCFHHFYPDVKQYALQSISNFRGD